MAAFLARLTERDERGQALVEYALIFTLIVVICIVVLMLMGNTVKNMFCNVAGSLAGA
jgi:Flp pilus assembly pilin Flp